MTINFTERKMTVSDVLKEYAEKKCGKLSKYFGDDCSAQVTFSNERGMQTAEITVTSRGMYFRAQDKTTDMYASIDGAVAAIDRQIQKNKTKISKRLRQDSFAKAMPIMTDYSDREEAFEILREKVLDVKPMTAEDAILQMNLLGHSFFFFENSERGGKHCVVYRRNDGGYGMLIAN
ncbi:MAG: ribosome-associated translation inhibitor RaiA [Clostridia bacterium]|nr:ribosome-associated translation inhibitor RaiA [Clostridia bacterium]